MAHPEVTHIRTHGQEYVRELWSKNPQNERRALGATALDGGVMSACLLVDDGSQPVVAKFSAYGTPSEGKTLQLWGQHDVKVPRVYDYGIVPSTENSDIPVAYTIMQAVTRRSSNELAPNVLSIVEGNRHLAHAAGNLIGIELAKMHTIQATEATVGSYNIIGEFNNPTSSWNAYLLEELRRGADGLNELGYSQAEIDKIRGALDSLPYDSELTYVHNDPAMSNLLAFDTDPLDIRIIDPNVIVGDRHLDFAHLANRVASSREVSKLTNDPRHKEAHVIQATYYDSARQAYEDAGGRPIDDKLLVGAQLPPSIKAFNWFRQQQPSPRLEAASRLMKHHATQLLRFE